MPTIEREKTKYPGVYTIQGTDPVSGKPEKKFYIVYRKDGKQIEKKAGRQTKDAMTAARGVWILRNRKDGRDTGFPLPNASSLWRNFQGSGWPGVRIPASGSSACRSVLVSFGTSAA